MPLKFRLKILSIEEAVSTLWNKAATMGMEELELRCRELEPHKSFAHFNVLATTALKKQRQGRGRHHLLKMR